MASKSGASTSSASALEASVVGNPQIKPSWSDLFAFTKRSHAGVLSAAIAASAVTAALRTLLAIFLGRVFDVIAEFGNKSRSGDSALQQVSKLCLLFVGLGFANWLANTAFLSLWIAFGELQADSVRLDIFSSLLARDLAWFDTLDQGISSLLVRIQTCVIYPFLLITTFTKL